MTPQETISDHDRLHFMFEMMTDEYKDKLFDDACNRLHIERPLDPKDGTYEDFLLPFDAAIHAIRKETP